MPRLNSKSKNKGQVSPDIATAENQPQLDIASVLPLLSVSQEIPPKMDNTTEDQLQLNITTVSPLRELPDMQEMDHNVDTTTIEDFDIQPSKKAKISESTVLDDQFPSPTISTSSMLSECSESIGSETDNQRNELDDFAHSIIEEASEKELLVKIDDIYVHQRELVCLLDHSKWLDDDVLGAYICCIKDQNKNAEIYFENLFYTGLLKRDGDIGIHGATYMTEIVKNYLKHDMIYLPINIKNSHWYLAIINIEKTEIQVIDSLCWEFNRADLTTTLRGLQYHLDILKSQENMISDNWKDIDLTKWTIMEQLHTPIQKDRKVWVKSSIPYPISLTLKNLQEILNEKLAMDRDCFNLVVRKIVSDDIETIQKRRGLISKHYLDMRFWMITDFGRHQDFRKKLDVEKLAYSVSSWPGMKYSVSSCKSIHIPIQQSGSDFILVTLDKDTNCLYFGPYSC